MRNESLDYGSCFKNLGKEELLLQGISCIKECILIGVKNVKMTYEII